jgi:TonB family protein
MSLPFTESGLFSPLPQWKMPWSDFVLSYSVQAVIIAILVWIPVLHPEILESPAKDYRAIELVSTPFPVNPAPQRRLPPVLAAKLDPPPAALHLPAQPKPKPKIEDLPAPEVEVKLANKLSDPLPLSRASIIPKQIVPKQVVTINTFSSGSSAPQTLARTPQPVQTGGFGDPNGVPSKTTQTRAVNIAQAGGFDMPTGPGSGNGTGGAKGARGVVASAGFGGGIAISDAHASSRDAVRPAGFGDADVPAPPTFQSHSAVQATDKIVPAEILSKPVPLYTAEARAQRIEGEVLLEAVFEANGKIRVLKIVRGLGHGLDDAAVNAAEQIRFKPALRDGQPSDSTVVLHIIFQLA